MDTRIISVSFGSNQHTTVKAREQYSYGQELLFSNIELPDVFDVYFATSPYDGAIQVVGDNKVVQILDDFFKTSQQIIC